MKPRDRDFVETNDGLLFCIVGYLHPDDRYTAYLKYVPEKGGKWSRGETQYIRVLPYYHVSQVENFYSYLEKNYSDYLYDCPVRNIQVSTVPKADVKQYYNPRERLKSLFEDPKDKLEYKLQELVTILSCLSGLDIDDFGVTGSILTSSHNTEFSDMDITVYGLEATRKLKNMILEIRGTDQLIQPFSASKKETWSKSRANIFPLGPREFMDFAEKRWNYGFFRDTYFSIHAIRTDEEITETYGDRTHIPLNTVQGDAEISDSSESIFLPAIYKLRDVELEGENFPITSLASFESIFCDMFADDDRISFSGKLEKISDGTYQVVIGGAGSTPSYIKKYV